jgi:signal transduction histidine kinase
MGQDVQNEQEELYLSIIQRNAKRINDLISELLNTSRPTEIKLDRQCIQTILDDVIASSIDSLTLKHLDLQVSYPNESLEIMADREKLKLALSNIVINAIEAMKIDVGRLSILLQQEDDHAIVTIADNGAGISEENISRLFEPYFTQKRNGVGLGLTFTLNILQSHRARIEVSSEIEKGTMFVIHFPLA